VLYLPSVSILRPDPFLLFLSAFLWEREDPCRSLYRVTSLPLGVPVELEIIFEVAN